LPVAVGEPGVARAQHAGARHARRSGVGQRDAGLAAHAAVLAVAAGVEAGPAAAGEGSATVASRAVLVAVAAGSTGECPVAIDAPRSLGTVVVGGQALHAPAGHLV